MKKNIIITMLLSLFLYINSYSQNNEPSQRTFTFGGNTQTISSTLDYFKINKFTLGWHWGDQFKISKALKMNQADISSVDNGNINPETNLFIRSQKNGKYFWSHAYFDNHAIFGKSLKYDPTLYIDPNNVYKLNKRDGDPSNPVFGFRDKHPKCTILPETDYTNANYSRLIVSNDPDLKNKVILANPWPNDIMYYTLDGNVDAGVDKDVVRKDFSGRSLYVSINLKRHAGSSLSPDTPILRIRVPYTYIVEEEITVDNKKIKIKKLKEDGLAYFYGIPSTTAGAFSPMPQNNGNAWDLITPIAEDRPQYIEITEKMLPSDGSSITISGYIDFAGIKQNENTNFIIKQIPHVKGLENPIDRIDKLNIEVEYLNSTTEVAIDWVKFETPNAQKINRGYYDDDIAESVQSDLTFYGGNTNYASNTIKPTRWIVHIEGSPINWEAERHFRKIVGDVTTGAVGGSLGAHWDEYLGNADKWIEVSALTSYVSSPYCLSNEASSTLIGTKTNTNFWKTMSMKQGCTINPYRDAPNNNFDRFNSGYETFIRSKTATVETIRDLSLDLYTTNDEYVAYTQGKISFQAYWEWGLYQNFVNPYNSGFAFSEKPWFGQHFVQEILGEEDHWDVINGSLENIKSYRIEDFRRVQTAEETSLFIWNPIIMGAKGLMYDGGTDYKFIPDGNDADDKPDQNGQLKLTPTEDILKSRFGTDDNGLYLIDDFTFINSNKLTGDFLDESYNHIPFLSKLAPNNNTTSMLDVIALNMGTVKKNGDKILGRIYMGKRSQRNKLFEVHNWIRENDEELMNLKLMAWYGKGYKIWEKPEPTTENPSIISKYIDKDNITTRKLYNVTASGAQPNILYSKGVPIYQTNANTYEDFVDVTLLERKVIPTGDTKKIFYIGVQNRRTDPTIYFTEKSDPNPLIDDKHLLFLSYSEFQDMCKIDSKNPLRPDDPPYNKDIWQSYWWKKLGCREINIPFDYVSTNKDHYNLLKVEELDGEYKNGETIIADENLPFHLQSAYNHKVDTVVGQDGILRLKLQPGQGKILRVTVLEPDLTTYGELDHSNQTKLVAFPVIEPDTGNESDKIIQYHMVYYSNTSSINKYKKGVFYRRSKPIKKKDGTENIEWENEILISNNIKVKNPSLQDIECNETGGETFYDCDYPSIVVRRVGADLRAFIVYSCNKGLPDNSQNAFIVLSVLNVKDLVNTTVLSNRVYEYYRASPPDNPPNTTEFGNPVINASKRYNFIAWSDYNEKIVTSYMLPDGFILERKQNITNPNFGFISQHPSLNPYSFLPEEDNCALVWQQNNIGTNPNIFYTRLKVENNAIVPYLASNTKNIIVNNNIAKLSVKANSSNTFPIILRAMNTIPSNYSTIAKRYDYVYWSEFRKDRFFLTKVNKTSIVGTCVQSDDESNTNSTFVKKFNEMRIEDPFFVNTNLNSPNLSLPHGIITANNQKINVGTHVLNFRRNSTSYNQTLGSGIFLNNITNVIFGNQSKIEKIASNTDQVHLAQHKENNYFENIWRNRRIYEESNYPTPRIVSNGKYFYKNNVEEKLETEAFVGFSRNANDYSVSNPYINNQEVGLALPYMPNLDTTGSKMILDFAQDTIFSNWFDVNTVAELNFKCYGFNDTIMVAKIQKQSDNSFINLNLPLSTTDTTGKLGEYTLINGGLSSYRLCFIRLDTNYQYTETIVLDGLPVSDTVMLKGTGTTKNIIDLSGNFNLSMSNEYFDISISPNPANDIVYMTPLYNDLKNQNLIEVEILDNLGNSIHKKVVKSGETFSFITSELAQGIYVVNCKEVTSDWLAPSFLKATKFVVNR